MLWSLFFFNPLSKLSLFFPLRSTSSKLATKFYFFLFPSTSKLSPVPSLCILTLITLFIFSIFSHTSRLFVSQSFILFHISLALSPSFPFFFAHPGFPHFSSFLIYLLALFTCRYAIFLYLRNLFSLYFLAPVSAFLVFPLFQFYMRPLQMHFPKLPQKLQCSSFVIYPTILTSSLFLSASLLKLNLSFLISVIYSTFNNPYFLLLLFSKTRTVPILLCSSSPLFIPQPYSLLFTLHLNISWLALHLHPATSTFTVHSLWPHQQPSHTHKN